MSESDEPILSESDVAAIPGVPGGSRNPTAAFLSILIAVIGIVVMVVPLTIPHSLESSECFYVTSSGSCYILYSIDPAKLFSYLGLLSTLFLGAVWLGAFASWPKICVVCNNRIVNTSSSRRRSRNWFSRKWMLRDPNGEPVRPIVQSFHFNCYKEILREQRRRCLNCDVPLYNPSSRDISSLPVIFSKRRQLFCSPKCLATYKPLEGLVVTQPTEVICPYCKSIYSPTLIQCPSCGAIRRRQSTSLLNLDPAGFEQKIAELLVRMGYESVTRVGGSGDRAVDVTAQRKDEFGRVLRYAVQCKRYDPSTHVGSNEMQVFCSMIDRVHRADGGIYVTTSSFTSEAAEIARRFSVKLVDGKLLEELLSQYA